LTGTTSTFDIYISGSTSRFGVALWRGYGTGVGFFGFERSKDNTGADTDEYGTLLRAASTSTTQIRQYTLPKNGTSLASPGTETFWLASMTSLSSSSFNNKKGLCEIKPFVGKYGNPMTIAAGLTNVDWGTDAEVFTATMYGTSRTFMVVKNVISTGSGTLSPTLMAMRWD
jgi:hypothetical protein